MGSRIPEFATRTLASSLVGTIGVETAVSDMFGQIARSSAYASDVFRQKKMEKQRTMDIVASDAKAREYELEMDDRIVDIKKGAANDPQSAIKIFNDQETLEISQYLDGVPDSQKAMVSNRITGMTRQKNNAMRSWARDQQVKNAGADFAKIDNLESGKLRLNPSKEAYIESQVRNELRRAQANEIFSAQGAIAAISNGAKSRAFGVLYGFAEKDPLEGRRLLKTDLFDSALSPTEKEKFIKEMNNRIKGLREEIDFENLMSVVEGTDAFTEEFKRSGKINLDMIEGKRQEWEEEAQAKAEFEAEVNGEDPSKAVGVLSKDQERILSDSTKVGLQGQDWKSVASIEVKNKLFDQLRNLGVSSDKRTVSSKTTIEDLINFKANVLEAMATSGLDPTTFGTLLNTVSTPIGAGVQLGITARENERGRNSFVKLFTRAKTPKFDLGYDHITDWIDDMKFPDDYSKETKVEMVTDMLVDLEFAADAGLKVDDELVNRVTDKIITKKFIELNPRFRFAKDGDVFEIPETGLKIMKEGNSFRQVN